ncbi:MAG: hypothetical protein H7210_01815, partial [Pyrinomonadaceae bacterium]|nr:hypothetical protein [Phycisphaerales bacterium]
MLKGVVGISALLILGCGDHVEQVDYILTSEHFEVRVHPGAIAPPGMLDGLEEHYRVTQAYLGFPSTKVLYSLYGSLAEVQRACGILPLEGLACARGRQVLASDPWNEHELIHAYLWGVGDPPPIFAEGIAQGIRCGGAALPVTVDIPPWQIAVAQPPRGNRAIYDAGFFLFVHLADTFGIDRFVEFYAETPSTLDPNIFRRQFESFWGVSVDQTWKDMRLPRAGVSSITAVPLRTPICPCTQSPALTVDGAPRQVPARQLISLGEVQGVPADWVLPLPDGDPGPYLFFTKGSTFLRSCAQDRTFDLRGRELDSSERGMVTVTLLAPERHYVAVAGIGPATVAVTRGEFLASSCEGAAPITVAPDSSGEVSVRVAADAVPADTADWYWRIAVPGPTNVLIKAPLGESATLRVCPSCDQTAADCVDVPPTRSLGGDISLNADPPELVFHVSHPPDAYRLSASVAVFARL